MMQLNVDPLNPESEAVERAAAIIRAEGLVALPTDTFYGLAADPRHVAAVQRVFAVKGRHAGQPLPLVAADLAQLQSALGPLSPSARALADCFWPGPLTLIVPSPQSLATEVTGGLHSVGVRVPGHEVPRAVCRAVGWPLTATSANVSGQPALDDPVRVAAAFGESIDLILDAGRTPGGPPSTIVDVSDDSPRLVRPGAIPWEKIVRCLHA
jgi:L-threonylcarbamoyladenylate synthase